MLTVLVLSVAGCGDAETPGGATASGVDARLVGHWLSTFKTGHTVSDNYMNLYVDGRYEVSSRTESAHPGTDTRWGPVIRGTWKAEDGRLYYTLLGSVTWRETGTYELSGRNSMVVTPPGGMAVLWERTN